MRINQTLPPAFAHLVGRRATDAATSTRAVEAEIVAPGTRSGGGFREDRPAQPGAQLMPMLLKVQEVASRLHVDATMARIQCQAAETRAARGSDFDYLV